MTDQQRIEEAANKFTNEYCDDEPPRRGGFNDGFKAGVKWRDENNQSRITQLEEMVKVMEEALKSIAALHLTEKWQLDDIRKNSEVTYTDTMIARAALNQGDEK